ncbi:MAG: hypothetical protein QM504_11225 [Pseudomonadota bacterium]
MKNTEHLKKYGYSGLFACHENLNDVQKWISQLAPTEKVTAFTAFHMGINTLLNMLDDNGVLNTEQSEEVKRKILVVLENGNYQATIANFDCRDVEIAMIDYDNTGIDTDMIDIPQNVANIISLEMSVPAYATYGRIDQASKNTIDIDDVFKLVKSNLNDVIKQH